MIGNTVSRQYYNQESALASPLWLLPSLNGDMIILISNIINHPYNQASSSSSSSLHRIEFEFAIDRTGDNNKIVIIDNNHTDDIMFSVLPSLFTQVWIYIHVIAFLHNILDSSSASNCWVIF